MSQFYQFYHRLVEDVKKLDITGGQRGVLIEAILMLKKLGFEEINYSVVDDTVTITANLPYQRRGV